MACLQLRRRLRQRRNGSPLQLHERRLQMTTSSVTRSSGRHHHILRTLEGVNEATSRFIGLSFKACLCQPGTNPFPPYTRLSAHPPGAAVLEVQRLRVPYSKHALGHPACADARIFPAPPLDRALPDLLEKKGSASRLSCLLVLTSATTISTYMKRTTP